MNTKRLQAVYQAYNMKKLPIRVGQLLEIHENVVQGDGEKIWRFKGLVIKTRKPSHPDGTFTVRGESSGIKIEKVYPFCYTKFKKVLLLDEYKIRRSKLYYIRHKIGKAARMKSILPAKKRNTNILV